MKKLILLGVSALLLVPLVSFAQVTGPSTQCTINHTLNVGSMCPQSGTCTFDSTTYACGICCVLNAIFTVTDWIFFALIAIVALLVIFGGFTIATAGGDPGKVNTGRNYILFAMLGFAVALLSRAIPSVGKALIGVS